MALTDVGSHLGRATLLLAFASVTAIPGLGACGSSTPSNSGATDASAPGDAADTDAGKYESGLGSSDSGKDANDATSDSGEEGSTPAGDASSGCVRAPAPADRARFVVVSHPFAADGSAANAFEVLNLTAGGTLSRPSTPVVFAMSSASNAPVLFTPDGQVGLVAQDDGTIGVFRLDASGAPHVVTPGYHGAFFAMQLALSADGSHVYALDLDTAANHGGVYELAIACDGSLSGEKLVVPGGTAMAMAILPTDPTRALLASGAAFNAPAGADTDLIGLAPPSLVASTTAFDEDAGMPIVSSVAVAPDGKFALLADDGAAAGSRLAVVAISNGSLTPLGELATPFPTAVVISPFDNAALVLNDDSTDQIHVMTYDPANPSTPFVITGELAYEFPPPQIPTTASMITRGMLEGTVFVSENSAVRELTFTSAGDVVDSARLTFGGDSGDDLASIVGVVGVQP